MPSFKDNAQKEWFLKLDGPKIREVRETCGVSLAAVNDGELFVRLAEDKALLVDVLWVLCRDQAGDITDVDFADLLFGDPIEHATEALIDAVILSFPVGRRSLLRALWKKQAAIVAKGLQIAEAKLASTTVDEAMEAKLAQEIDEAFHRALGISTGPIGVIWPPEKSESVPTV